MICYLSLHYKLTGRYIPVHHQSSYHDLTPNILIYKWDGEVAYHINIIPVHHMCQIANY
jgi:hypothetical protein